MKIKQISVFVGILVFFLLLPSVLFSLSNLAFGLGNNYIFSNNFNKYLEKIFPKNDMLNLKKGDFYYRMGQYQKAMAKYLKINCKTEKKCFTLYHNIGNTYYKLGEYTHNTMEKISFWQQSVVYYQRALDIKYDDETKKNYDFVLEKLRESIDELREKNESQSDQQQQQEENNEEIPNKTPNQEENQDNQQIQPRGPSIKIDEFSQNAGKELSKEEKESIEEYLNNLQQEERQNIELNKPRQQRDIFDILGDDFFFEGFDRNESEW